VVATSRGELQQKHALLQVKKRLVPPRSWGFWHAESNWQQQQVLLEGAAAAETV
jgi:hypothetical protein